MQEPKLPIDAKKMSRLMGLLKYGEKQNVRTTMRILPMDKDAVVLSVMISACNCPGAKDSVDFAILVAEAIRKLVEDYL